MTTRRPAEVFHPGEYLRDELAARNWSQIEFAEIIGRDKRLVNEIIKGKRGISPDTAREIGAALGTSAEVWMNLDNAYNLWKSDKDVSEIEHRAKMWTKYPVRDMTLRNWLLPSEDTKIIESQLLRHFETNRLEDAPQLAHVTAARRSDSDEEGFNSIQLAWLYRVKHIADAMPVPKYSKNKLRNALEKLTAYREYVEDLRHIPQLLEECGVRFVIVEPLSSSKIDGVCLWLGNAPVIGMTLRFDRIDNFWFVLRHEIEHALNGDGRDSAVLDSDIMGTQGEETLPDLEKKANAAAAEFCVPQAKMDDFIDRRDPIYSRKDVLRFAKSLRVHPGLVAGQLRWKTGRFRLFTNMLVSVRDEITPVSMVDGFGQVLPVQI